jgi:hypothetical protein
VHKLCDVISSQPHGLRFRYLISWGGLNALVWFEGRPRRDGAILFSPVFGWEVFHQCLVGRCWGRGHFCSGIFLKYADSSAPLNRVDEAIPCGPRRTPSLHCQVRAWSNGGGTGMGKLRARGIERRRDGWRICSALG